MVDNTSKYAKRLSELGASKGGEARAKKLSAEERTEIARKAARARWDKNVEVNENDEPSLEKESDESQLLPIAAYSGALDLFGNPISCYVLDNGVRVIGRMTANEMLTSVKGAGDLERTIGVRSLKPFLDFDFVTSQFIAFRSIDTERLGNTAKGMPADVFIDICRAFVTALDANYHRPEDADYPEMTEKQKEIAIRASMFLASVAKVGLDALIDEATGYQEVREKNALEVKLKAYLEEEMRKWEKTFPDDLWMEFGRLTGWSKSIHKRPKYWGKLVMELIYEYLEPDVAQWLRENAPKPKHGKNYHQWLSSQYGLQKLVQHIWQVIGMAKSCENISELKQAMAKTFGSEPIQLTLKIPKSN